MKLEIEIENILSKEEIKEITIEAIKEYTKEKCEHYTCENKGYYNSLYETIALAYMLDNYKERVDTSIDASLKNLAHDLFRARHYDKDNARYRLESEVIKRLGSEYDKILEAFLERIKTLSDDGEKGLREAFEGIAEHGLYLLLKDKAR